MKKTVGKFPSYWPFVSPEQQFEGFKITIENSDITVWEFERRMMVLVRAKFMSKSHMRKLITWFRHIKGISYKEYLAKRNRAKVFDNPHRGLWW